MTMLSTATQWGPGRTGQIEVVKKELCSHVTGSCFALRPGIPVDPLRSHWTQWPGQQQSQTQIYWQPLTYTLPDRWKHAWLTWYNRKKCLRHTQLKSEVFALFLHLSTCYNWCYIHIRCSRIFAYQQIVGKKLANILLQNEHCGLFSMWNLVTMVTLEDRSVG